MFSIRSCVYALLAASAFADVSAIASRAGDEEQPLPSSARQITPIDNVLSSMFLKRSGIPRDAAINLIPKSSVALASFSGMLRRNLFEGVITRRTEPECGECSGETNDLARRADDATGGVAGVTNVDPATWEKNVTSSCMKAMGDMKGTPNPAGMAVCYNLPFVDMGAGTFSSDLRLYRVGKADSMWSAIGSKVSVSVLYNGAMIQLESTNNKRSLEERAAEVTTTSSTANATDGSSDATLLKTFHFVGQINKEMMPDASMTYNDTLLLMKKILSPDITLMGMTPDGNMVNTSMKTNEASFVTGVFAAKQVAPAAPAKFVLPGTKISINPVGLYMFAAYTFVFCAVVGWGTFERIKYRDQFRRRVAHRETDVKKSPKI